MPNILLKYPDLVNEEIFPHGFTLFINSMFEKRFQAARVLLLHGGDPLKGNGFAWAPLYSAAVYRPGACEADAEGGSQIAAGQAEPRLQDG